MKRGLFFKGQNQLTDLAKALKEEKVTTDAAQLKQLQTWEKMVKDYRADKSVLSKVTNKKKGGGLIKLQIKENGSTRNIMDLGPMAETLQDYFVKHYGQENHTIFGHGEGHTLFTADPMSNPV